MFLRPLLAAASIASLATVAGLTTAVPAGSAAAATPANVVTPGNFLGFGFDQCNTPSQKAMNAWLRNSPYLAAGIYISGASRACTKQPNLTSTWVSTQLRNGWRLLPIDVGPQAPCNPRFPRHGKDPVISNAKTKAGTFDKARRQGIAEAHTAVTAATKLGIVAGSTLWFDLENFNQTVNRCRNASLSFMSGWTTGLHALHYVSGVYSSAGSGIWALDQARMKTPTKYQLPDRIWIARWDGQANTSTSYISSKGWATGDRMKQYVGGHDETWGDVTINIDRDFLDLGKHTLPAVEHCGGVVVDLPDYPRVKAGSSPTSVKALQCLLSEQKAYAGKINGRYTAATLAAINGWQKSHHLGVHAWWNRRNWMTLFGVGPQPVLKFGSTGPAVRRLQRMLNAATRGTDLPVTGVFAQLTDSALRGWQISTRRKALGVVNPSTWKALAAGTRTS
jgi:peptidoglycan hydrolase-like protein with peptidoglycan-binding domain